MKTNKPLIIIILLGFFTFGMTYNNLIKESFVAPFVKQVTKFEKKHTNKIVVLENKKSLTKENKTSINSVAAPVAATITVNNTVAINGGGNALPGSQLDFTIKIENKGTDNSIGTIFKDILDPNLTLVPNSLKVTPIAVDDAYNCIGNVGITLNAGQGVLANDISPDGTTLSTIISIAPAHGDVILAADGSFVYDSAPGYSGPDSFEYTLTSTNGKTSTGTVNITISKPIFFVNSSSVASSANGTLTKPFKLVENVPSNNDNSFVFIYTGAANSGNILTLSNNQKVIGQGATASLIGITGIVVPSYSNTLPYTGGTSPTFNAISLKSNNDIEGVILSSNMTGSNVGNLKVRDVSITGGNATPVNINGGGALNCIFKSVSASGANNGIAISNSTGSFTVTGTGTTAGSGGTLQNIINNGADLNSCTNITFQNMNFINSKVFGIKINNVSNFTLSNSAITGSGSNVSSSDVGGIYAVNLTGTTSITNTNVNDSWGRGFYVYNNLGTSNLTVTNCQFKNAFNKSNGDNNFIFQAYGASNNTLVLKGNDFSNAKNYGLALNFGGTSTNTIQVGGNATGEGNTINAAIASSGSNGLSLQSNGAATVNYNIVKNTIKSSFNGVFTCNIGSQGIGTMKGRVTSNTIDAGGINSISNGISVNAYGNSKHITEITNNIITNANNYGILSEANDGEFPNSTARIDATIKNNTITSVANSYADVAITAIKNNTGSTLTSVANVADNIINTLNGDVVSNFDVLSQGTGSQVILQGNTPFVSGAAGVKTAQLTTFWNANNPGGTYTAIDEDGGGTILAGTALIPDNASSKFVTPKNIEETVTPIVENKINNEIIGNESTQKSAVTVSGETISVGPFTFPLNKPIFITFSATINDASALSLNTCQVTNMASVSGSNFATVNSNITTTSIKPANATFTTPAPTQNIPCLGNTTVTLNATCPLGTTPTWYTALTGGTSFATGESVTATPTTNNTTYCVACETAYCASDRLLVKTITGTASTISTPEAITRCDTYTWPVNGSVYTASGTYTAAVGCDTKTLNLIITNSTTSTPEAITRCDTYTWPANGSVYTTSGTYTAVVGCDTKTLNLTITTSSTSTPETITRCDTYTWPVNSSVYTASGTYTEVVGCDTKTLNLTITTSSASTPEAITRCDTYTWPVNGSVYTASGIYTHIIGCETKTLDLTITTSTTSAPEIVTQCDTYTWPVNGSVYTSSGIYTKIVGCETKTLDLTINDSSTINSTVSLNSGVLSSNHLGATYQWYKCPNTLLTNEIGQSFTPLTNGDYKVEITSGNCKVTSICTTISNLAIDEFKQNQFKIYPNPSKGIVNIISPYKGNYIIIDQSGRTIKTFDLDENIVNTLSIDNVSEGIYYIKSISNTKIKTQKLIIKK